jgi:YVTN family beta-propeller protein
MAAEWCLRARHGWGAPVSPALLAVALAAVMLLPWPVGPREPALAAGVDGPIPSVPPVSVAPSTPALNASETVGSVAYSWDLVNDTTYYGAYNATNPENPAAMAVDSVTDQMWVGWGQRSTGGAFNVSLVDLARHQVVGTVPDTEYAESILFDPLSNTMFLAEVANLSTGAGELAFLNATTGIPVHPAVPVGRYPGGMVLDGYAQRLYVADNGSGGVTSINVTSGALVEPFVPTGAGADSVAYDPLTGDVFVANFGANNLTVLNGSRGLPDGPGLSVQPAHGPDSVTYDPLARDVLLMALTGTGGSSGRVVVVVDPAIRAVVALESFSLITTTLEGAPIPAALDPVSGNLLIPGCTPGGDFPGPYQLTIFDPLLNAFNTTNIPTGEDPTVEAVDTAQHIDYVAHWGEPAYLVPINLTSGQNGTPVLLGAYPGSGTYDPASGKAYVVDSLSVEDVGLGTSAFLSEPDQVVALNATGGGVSGVVPIGYDGTGLSGGYAPSAIAYVPPANALLVPDAADDSPEVVLNATSGALEGYLSSGTELGEDCAYFGLSWPCGYSSVAYDPIVGPYAVMATPDGALDVYYATNLTWDQTWAGPTGVLPFTAPPVRYELLAVDPDNGSIFYLDPSTTSVYDVNLTSEAYTGGAVGNPALSFLSGIIFDPLDGYLYVTDYNLNLAYVVNATTLGTVATIPVGVHPVGIAFNPRNDWIEVANSGSGNVTLLNGSSVASGKVGEEAAGVLSDPEGIFIDPDNGETFVSGLANGVVEALAPVPVVGSFTADPATTDVGRAVALHAVASGGAGAFHYAYTGLPPGCSSADTPTLECVPQSSGEHEVTVTVTDAAPGVASAAVMVGVDPDPTVLIAPTATAVDGTTAISFNAVPSNGTPPYAATWRFGDGGSGSGLLVDHAYSAPGVYVARVTLTDAVGGVATASVQITVGGPLSVVVTRSGNDSISGEEAIFNASVIGGLAPFEFRWDFGSNQTLVTGASGGASPNSSSVAHLFASPGQYRVSVTISDGGGESTTAQWNITVIAGPNRTGPSPSPSSSAPFPALPVGLAVADIVAAAAIAGIVYRRRRHGGRG